MTTVVLIAATWIGTLLLLLSGGGLLSWLTLRAARRVPPQPSGRAQGADALLRRVYRAVLWVSCAFYWISIPLVILMVLAAASGVIYLLFSIGHIPIKIILAVVILAGVTLKSIVKSLFVRSGNEDPGLRLDLAGQPRLRALLDEVAARIGTRPVDNVYLTPGTDLAVLERGGMLRQLGGQTERCLILGVGVLDGLDQSSFKAILAHEYGHFSNLDTAGGGFALAVRRSIVTMARHLAEGGAATWYNPAWWFVNGFHRVFLRISQGASRLQEVLADRWAAFTYGAAAFERGLRHVIERSALFGAHANAAVSLAIDSRTQIRNLYRFNPAELPQQEDLSQEIAAAMSRPPTPYDSHPAPLDRFAWAHAVAGSSPAAPEETAEVWSLFEDREGLEYKLTQAVCASLASRGVVFAS